MLRSRGCEQRSQLEQVLKEVKGRDEVVSNECVLCMGRSGLKWNGEGTKEMNKLADMKPSRVPTKSSTLLSILYRCVSVIMPTYEDELNPSRQIISSQNSSRQ